MRVTVQNIIVNWVFLNNEMDDFSAKAGVPTCWTSGNEANSIARKENVKLHDTYHREKTESYLCP
jgi:hypothetical protein